MLCVFHKEIINNELVHCGIGVVFDPHVSDAEPAGRYLLRDASTASHAGFNNKETINTFILISPLVTNEKGDANVTKNPIFLIFCPHLPPPWDWWRIRINPESSPLEDSQDALTGLWPGFKLR